MSNRHDPFQDNKKSTDTSQIAPGAPIWYRAASGVHNNRDAGHGYSAQDPIPLSKGDYTAGSAITRFGKIGFKKSMNFVNTQHGEIIDFPILREEGSQGEWTVIIKQPDNPGQTGRMGSYNTAIEHGYDVCRVDVDLYTLNASVPGVNFDTSTGELSVTFLNGETEKLLKMVVPYRTTVKELAPDVLRQKVTYHVAEYVPYNFGKYRNNQKPQAWETWGAPVRRRSCCHTLCYSRGYYYYYCRRNSRTRNYTYDDNDKRWIGNDVLKYSIDHNNQSSENRWVWYKVYTMPLPRTWIENLAGNTVYIDEYDTNYNYRQENNTCRGGPTRPNTTEPYRQDDKTFPDQPAEGIIARYDHINKMDLVAGRSRLTSMYMHKFNHTGSKRGGAYAYYGVSRYCYSYGTRAQYVGQHYDMYGYWTPQTEHFISNDRRITHRANPQYAGATVHGVLYRPILKADDTEAYMFSINDTWTEMLQWDGQSNCTGYQSGKGNQKLLPAASQRPVSDYLKPRWSDVTYDTTICSHQIFTHDQSDQTCWRHGDCFTTINISDNSPLKSEVNYRPGGIWDAMYTMQTGYYQGKSGRVDQKIHQNHDGTVMTNVDTGKPFDSAINSHDRPDELKYTMIPLNHTGWVREDFPGDPWFKTYNDRGLTYYPSDPSAVDTVGDGRVIEAYSYFLGSKTSTGKEFVKGIHPITPDRFHEYDSRITWKDGIPPKWQSFYESTRYNNGEDANTLHWSQERQDAVESRLGQNHFHHMSSDPSDKVFNYGNPINNVGDLAQVMFNHRGTETKDYITGTDKGNLYNSYYTPTAEPTEYFVLLSEDPSNIKHLYDGLGSEFATRHSESISKYISMIQSHGCARQHGQARDTFMGGGSTWELTRPENWTDQWLVHAPQSAGRLDLLDVPNNSNNFSGYRWDNNSLDTVNGSELAQRGLGSSGHGEQGKSRVLYDMRDITHPLSSYDMNDDNLKGYYTCCVDHIDRVVDLQISKLNEEDPVNLGVVDAQINIVHATGYDPTKHESYDYRIKGDSRIEIGPTFATNDDWDGTPTAPSVTDRLFTADGSLPTNPVVFLGFSKGATPGGNPENPVPDPPKRPALLRMNPLMNRDTFNVPTTVNPSVPYNRVRTFQNVGESDLVLRLPYEFTAVVPENFEDSQVSFKGDDPSFWTWKYIDVETGAEFPGLSRPSNNRPGPSGLHNTVSLSAGEKIAIQYQLNGRSEQRMPYLQEIPRSNYCWKNNTAIKMTAPQPPSPDPADRLTFNHDVIDVANSTVTRSTDLRDKPVIVYDGSLDPAAAEEPAARAVRCEAQRNFVQHQITVEKQGEDPILRTITLEAKYKD